MPIDACKYLSPHHKYAEVDGTLSPLLGKPCSFDSYTMCGASLLFRVDVVCECVLPAVQHPVTLHVFETSGFEATWKSCVLAIVDVSSL